MARKVLLVSALSVTILALLGAGILLLAPGSGAVAGVEESAAPPVEPQTTAANETTYKIHVPWPTGWISQIEIITKGEVAMGEFEPGEIIHAVYPTVSTTSYKWKYSVENSISQWMFVGESSTFEIGDTPLSDKPADMAKYLKENLYTFYAWAEGDAAGGGVYAPVAKQARVIELDCGDSAYAVHLQGHWFKEPANIEYIIIPKAKNQYFIILLVSFGMCEDELWHVQRYTTFTQNQ